MAGINNFHVPRNLIDKYAKVGPRYTSYPTAPEWSNEFNAKDAIDIIKENNVVSKASNPLAIYVHIPFCTSLCYYCGCNVKISPNKSAAIPYLSALKKEIEIIAQDVHSERVVCQMHWGGGTPTYLSPEQIIDLTQYIQKHFKFMSEAEISIEVDPRVTTIEHIKALRSVGFNRISMGLQSFDEKVQQTVSRVQPFEATAQLIEWSRQEGFESINVDLMYGLPFQSMDTFNDTLDKVFQLNPDRIALFNYAHVPWLKPAQKLLKEEDMPDRDSKLDIFELAIDRFLSKGYVYIGMDHFAKESDELSKAQKEHTLRRNFMGYTTYSGIDLYGFGVSSISEIDGHFIQNQRFVPEYKEILEDEQLPVLRGLKLEKDDHIRKAVISDLSCNCFLDFNKIESEFHINFRDYFETELNESRALEDDGLIKIDSKSIEVLPEGQILIRNVCMIWDAYLKKKNAHRRFSRTI